MATISFTIPDAILPRVLDAMAYGRGYTDTITQVDDEGNVTTIPNPITKAQFAKNELKNWVKANVVAYESSVAAESARLAAVQDANDDIILGD